MEIKLRLAIQQSGRLSEKSIELLKICGIPISRSKNNLLGFSSEFPLEILFVRDDDIPEYVQNGIADIGIVGENVWEEKKCKSPIELKLGFAKCRLSMAIPKNKPYKNHGYFKNKTIATTYPVILKKYLDEKGINAEIRKISGSTEIAPNLGLSEAICDIVSSGSTLFFNGLKEVETIFKSEAILIKNLNLSNIKQDLVKKLSFRIKATLEAKKYRYIALNIPNIYIDKICNIESGLKRPTIIPLAEKGWSAMHFVVEKNNFWNIIDALLENKAEGILTMPIEKLIY